MESELELNDIIQEMHVIATVPDLYHILVDLNTVQSLLQLLSHENTDILYKESTRIHLMLKHLLKKGLILIHTYCLYQVKMLPSVWWALEKKKYFDELGFFM